MQDKNQGSGLSGTIRKLLCSRPHQNQFYIKKPDSYQRNQRRLFSY